jgi:DNA-binding SARP family transcriptional activator
MAMLLRVLGPLEVRVGDGWTAVPAPKWRALLAALLAEPNRVVTTGDLISELWGSSAPAGARKLVSGYVLQLRRLIADPAGHRLVTQAPGYRLAVVREDIDAACFEDLLAAGRRALHDEDAAQASDLLTRALALWRGPALADVPRGPKAAAEADRLDELYLAAVELRIDASMRSGRTAGLVAELRALTAKHPLREQLWYRLMLVLEDSGRTAEALAAYSRAQAVIGTELGADPGPDLRQLHLRLLRGGPPDGGRSTARPPILATSQPTRPVVPQQLPAPVRNFTGRTRELAALTKLMDQSGGRIPDGAAVCAISGPPGVGKTALALRWAQQATGRFPDGQLYVNLRGYDEDDPVSAPHVLSVFLRGLGVDSRDIAADGQERAAQYRTVLAGRRALVVLDNARDAEQARPLLPGTSGCFVIVTSRDMLSGLVARNGAERMQLGALPVEDALALLRALLGARVDAEPEAAAALADLCCCLPLALRVAAERASARAAVPLASLVDELTDERQRLDLLDAGSDGGTAVRSVFSWSYRHLESAVARAFRLVGLHPGPDLEPYAAATLTGSTPRQARRLLADLARTHLIHETGPNRFGMYDLFRAYARELAGTEDGPAGHDALTGLLDYYLGTSAAAMDVLYPAETSRRPCMPRSAGLVAPVADAAAAQQWLDAERANLIAAAGHAADHGWPAHATLLSATLDRYFSFGYHLAEATSLHGHALRAARASGDCSAEAAALSHLGVVEAMRNGFSQAADYARQASVLFEATGNRAGLARALHRLALMERRVGQLQRSLEHATRCLMLCRQDDDRLGQARALQNLGTTKRVQGRFASAARDQRRALALFEELADRLGQSVTVRELGVIELRLGRLGPAADHLRQAQALCRETSNPNGQAAALSLLGLVQLRQGHHEQAVTCQQRALAAYRDMSDREGEIEVLARLALIDAESGQYRRALQRLELALDLARRFDLRPLENAVLNGLGEAALGAGDAGQACTWHTAALQLAGQTSNDEQQVRAYHGLALAHSALGDQRQAECYLQQSVSAFVSTSDGLGAAEAARIPAP